MPAPPPPRHRDLHGSLPRHPSFPGRQRTAVAGAHHPPPPARGYEYAPFSSLERVIEENKDEYYRTLRRAQSTLDKGDRRLGEWLAFFLRCLSPQMQVLERKVERERLMAALSALDESLLRLAREHGRLTVASAVKLTDANRNTAKLHLR